MQASMLIQVVQNSACHVLGGALCAVWMEVTQHNLGILRRLIGVIDARKALEFSRPTEAFCLCQHIITQEGCLADLVA